FSGPLDALHPFPTRRSSDLVPGGFRIVNGAGADNNKQTVVFPVQNVAKRFSTLKDGCSRLVIEFDFSFELLGSDQHVLADDIHRSEEHTSELQSRENLVCRL